MNKIMILGNLGKDPVLRKTNSGASVCNFSVATKSFEKRGDGPTQESTQWFSIITWNKVAENCEKHLEKGCKVFVEGIMQSREYEKDGKKGISWEIIAQNVQFLTMKKQNETTENSTTASDLDDIPF